MARQGANKLFHKAKKSKSDEFYTQYIDIQKEVEAYLEYNPDTFLNKVIYCNCDDPFESNFFRYFVLNFDRIGLKQLITTSYKPSPVANTQLQLFGDNETLKQTKGRPKVTANKFIINSVGDIDGDGEFSLKDVALQLKQNKKNLELSCLKTQDLDCHSLPPTNRHLYTVQPVVLNQLILQFQF